MVYNRAIHPDNPEIRAAKKLRIKMLPYAEVFGKLTKEYMTIAITGSHGKSTTTALAALALTAGGYDPTVLIGTTLKEFGGKNVRVGGSDTLVLEADDFGAAFTAYSPTVAIVMNIDREHLDFYKSFGEREGGVHEISVARTTGRAHDPEPRQSAALGIAEPHQYDRAEE